MSSSEIVEPLYQTIAGIPFPGSFSKDAIQGALSYKPKSEDLFIVSYPKCGTTWTQTLVYLIATGGVPAENSAQFFKQMPFLEMFGTESVTEETIAIKTHLPFDLAPYSSKSKYIYVTRNPKDAVVSLFHHTRTVGYLFDEGTFDVLFDLFLKGKTEFGDYFQHVLGGYARRHDENVLFLTYEDLKKDIEDCILKIAKFMGDSYLEKICEDTAIMENIVKYSSMEHMRKIFDKHVEDILENKASTVEDIDSLPIPSGLKHVRKFTIEHRKPTSKFTRLIREGKVGGWKNVLSEEQLQRIDNQIKESFQGTELYEMWK